MTAATWEPAWQVSRDGDRLIEARVSRTEYFYTVRTLDQTRGGERWARWRFELDWADSPAGAIEKFLTRQTTVFGKARAEMELAQLLIRRGEALRATQQKDTVTP